jgi:hypothetical protein
MESKDNEQPQQQEGSERAVTRVTLTPERVEELIGNPEEAGSGMAMLRSEAGANIAAAKLIEAISANVDAVMVGGVSYMPNSSELGFGMESSFLEIDENGNPVQEV